MFSFNSIVMMVISGVLAVLYFIASVYNRMTRKSYTHKVQKPGQLMTFFSRVMLILSILCAGFTLLGAMMKNTEMAVVFAVITIISTLLTWGIKRKYDFTYQETDEYFIVTRRKKTYKVYYKDISHWQWGIYDIYIQDRYRPEGDFIGVSVSLFKPEILLTKITEKVFAGEFPRIDGLYPDDTVYPGDPLRKKEIVRCLTQAGYSYLIPEYIDALSTMQQDNV